MRRVLAPSLALLLAVPGTAVAHDEEGSGAIPARADLPEELTTLAEPGSREAITDPARQAAVIDEPVVNGGALVTTEAGSVEPEPAPVDGATGPRAETLTTEVAPPVETPTKDEAPEPPAAEPNGDALGQRMARVGLGMIAVGSALAITSGALAGAAKATRNKLGTRRYDGFVNGTEDDPSPVEDVAEAQRRDELLVLVPRLRQGAAVTGIPAAVFVSTGVIMLAFSAAERKKQSNRISLRANLSPLGGGASLVAGF